MTVEHHPDEALLAAHAAGELDLGQRVAVATHLRACRRCREFAAAVECVGGEIMDECRPAEMAAGALQRVLERLDEPQAPALASPRPETADAPAGLPAFVRAYAFGEWRFVAPRVSMRPIRLPAPSPTRVFLLKSARSTKLMRHEHAALEMTCILEGGYARDGGHYGPGDFDFGDDSISHEPHIDDDGDCVALVAMQGGLRWKGFWGLLVRPFVRL